MSVLECGGMCVSTETWPDDLEAGTSLGVGDLDASVPQRGRKVDFVVSPIKVKFGLEAIARQLPGPCLGNSRPAGASLPF